jgi:hypothetical protein
MWYHVDFPYAHSNATFSTLMRFLLFIHSCHRALVTLIRLGGFIVIILEVPLATELVENFQFSSLSKSSGQPISPASQIDVAAADLPSFINQY